MAHHGYSQRSPTPGPGYTTIDTHARSRRTEDFRSQTPGPGRSAGRHVRAFDQNVHLPYTSSHLSGRIAERDMPPRQTVDLPCGDFSRLSLAPSPIEPRPAYHLPVDAEYGSRHGITFKEYRGPRPHGRSFSEITRPRRQETSTSLPDYSPKSGPTPHGQRPSTLIIGLFALRLARRLIAQLDHYPERGADLAWLDNFVSFYSPADDLAELNGSAMDEFAKTYPVVINHFIKERKFPIVFMRMDPTPRGMEAMGRRLTDKEARDMVDFADAAAEWGSYMKLPGYERERMESLAAQRRIARSTLR